MEFITIPTRYVYRTEAYGDPSFIHEGDVMETSDSDGRKRYELIDNGHEGTPTNEFEQDYNCKVLCPDGIS